ncbi:MAG: biotin--[acetyl-CoA-carboxylase] ligase [Chloroflexota bacterium]
MDSLTQDRLAARLSQGKSARHFQFFEQVDSTQDLALAWLRQEPGLHVGSAIVGDEQLKGRGRHGRTWYTPPGVALAVSVILKPAPQALSQVTMLGALAIAEMIDALAADAPLQPAVTIKWPNDVRLDGRKVSGVLPEAEWRGGDLLGVSLGMGINVRVDFTGSPLADTAVSIEPALGKTIDRAEAVALLLERVDHWAVRLGTQTLFHAWRSRLETVGRTVTVEGISGRAEGVRSDGALLLRDDAGNLHTMIAGDLIEQEGGRPS